MNENINYFLFITECYHMASEEIENSAWFVYQTVMVFFFNGAFSNRTNPVQFKQLKFDLLCLIKHKSYDFKKNCSAFVKCICRKHKYHRTLFIATKHILLWHFFPYCILLNHKSYMKASVSTLDSVYSHSNQILKQKLRFAG